MKGTIIEFKEMDYDIAGLTIEEIYCLIDMELIPKDYPVWYYNNQWWDETP